MCERPYETTKLDDRQNHLRDVAEPGRLTKVRYCAIMKQGRLQRRPAPIATSLGRQAAAQTRAGAPRGLRVPPPLHVP